MLKYRLRIRYHGYHENPIVYFQILDEQGTTVVWESSWHGIRDDEKEDREELKQEVITACGQYGISDMSDLDDYLGDYDFDDETMTGDTE